MAKEKEGVTNLQSPVSLTKDKKQISKAYPVQVQAKQTGEEILVMALQAGKSIEEISQLAEILNKYRNDELARVARLEFKQAKAKFLKTVPAYTKNRAADFGTTTSGKTGASYSYTDLDHLLNSVKEAEAEAGLSHDWDTSETNAKEEIVTVECILSHAGGHEKRDKLTWGFDKTGGKVGIHAMNSTISYLKRITLTNCLGLSQGGDDDGKQSVQQSQQGQETNGKVKPTEDGFRLLVKAVRNGSMTLDQATEQYSLTAEEMHTLQSFAPQNPTA